MSDSDFMSRLWHLGVSEVLRLHKNREYNHTGVLSFMIASPLFLATDDVITNQIFFIKPYVAPIIMLMILNV